MRITPLLSLPGGRLLGAYDALALRQSLSFQLTIVSFLTQKKTLIQGHYYRRSVSLARYTPRPERPLVKKWLVLVGNDIGLNCG